MYLSQKVCCKLLFIWTTYFCAVFLIIGVTLSLWYLFGCTYFYFKLKLYPHYSITDCLYGDTSSCFEFLCPSYSDLSLCCATCASLISTASTVSTSASAAASSSSPASAAISSSTSASNKNESSSAGSNGLFYSAEWYWQTCSF